MKLHERMQTYERSDRHYLTRRVPVIIRVDGRAFHTLTKHMDKPFDRTFMEVMVMSAEEVMREATGGVLAYIQSDEASFLLLDTAKVDTMPWFDYRQDKLVSLSASIMTMRFNELLRIASPNGISYPRAEFDARAFNIPMSDVANYFLHRARDWHRNSVQMLARAHFSHQQLYKKDRDTMIAMLANKQIYWNDLTPREARGTFLYREFVPADVPELVMVRRLVRDESVSAVYNDIECTLEQAMEVYHVKTTD